MTEKLVAPSWVRIEPEIYFAVKRDYHAGDRLSDIENRHSVSVRTINRWARMGQWRKGKDHRAHNTEKKLLVHRMIDAGKTMDDICRHTGISPSTFFRWRDDYVGQRIR